MKLIDNDTVLQNAAVVLANYIDKCAGDYPSLEFSPSGEEWLLWEYCRNSILVRFGSTLVELPDHDALTSADDCLEIAVRTVHDAIRLIKFTESIRQRRPDPYIVLSHMPVA